MKRKRPTALVFYHYFVPDDVISAVLFADACTALVESGWHVTAFPCVWGCRDESVRYPKRENWKGVEIRRLWRPCFPQSSAAGRLLNSVWMVMCWSLLALRRRPKVDLLVVGSDPPLSILSTLVWRAIHPSVRIVHWCHDLFPEAAVADGILDGNSLLIRVLRSLLGRAYGNCDSIADIGPCMSALLDRYATRASRETIVPWSPNEPQFIPSVSAPERARIFGNSRLALLYTGTLGRAHSYEAILDLLERLEPYGACLAFSIRGNRVVDLKRAVSRRRVHVCFLEFADAVDLTKRSGCADIHVVTLRDDWTGTVVPSKFFGALAAGRPVLFAGSENSSLARWIRQYDIGWVLHGNNVSLVADEILRYADSPIEQQKMQVRCFRTYHSSFSRAVQLEKLRLCFVPLRAVKNGVERYVDEKPHSKEQEVVSSI